MEETKSIICPVCKTELDKMDNEQLFCPSCLKGYTIKEEDSDKEEEFSCSSFVDEKHLMNIHKGLTFDEATSLKEFAKSKTIKYKECYGDGRIIYPLWKDANC